MSQADYGLRRRDFLAIGGTIFVNELLNPLFRGIAFADTQGKSTIDSLVTPVEAIISFDEAVKNPDLRQQYLDGIVKQEWGEEANLHVKKYIYDHDKLIVKQDVNDFLEVLMEDPEFLKTIYNGILKSTAARGDPEFQGKNEEQAIAAIRDYLKEDLSIRESLKAELVSKIDAAGLITLQNKIGYGNGVKSSIYISKAVFENVDIKKFGFAGDILPTEEGLVTALRHERLHARHFFDGIDLEPDLNIGRDHWNSIHPSIYDFTTESIAYMDGVNFSRQFGTEHPAHRFALIGFALYLYRIRNIKEVFNGYDPSPYEKKLLSYQLNIVEEFKRQNPELVRALDTIQKKLKSK